MTRKKCIKLIMGTMGLPQPRWAERFFRVTREWMHGETGPWPSSQEVLMAILTAMKETEGFGVSYVTYLLATYRLRLMKDSMKRIHDRLMGGPAQSTQP